MSFHNETSMFQICRLQKMEDILKLYLSQILEFYKNQYIRSKKSGDV